MHRTCASIGMLCLCPSGSMTVSKPRGLDEVRLSAASRAGSLQLACRCPVERVPALVRASDWPSAGTMLVLNVAARAHRTALGRLDRRAGTCHSVRVGRVQVRPGLLRYCGCIPPMLCRTARRRWTTRRDVGPLVTESWNVRDSGPPTPSRSQPEAATT